MANLLKHTKLMKAAETEDELAKINQFTLRPLEQSEVFLFRLAACDNQIDRDWERFSDKALEDLAPMFVGKTVLVDHDWEVKNQVARVYDAYVQAESGKKNLVLCCYMLIAGNEVLASAIEAGIMKECSVGVSVGAVICSICGVNQCDGWCQHRGGAVYEDKQCWFSLEQPLDAYEVSLVAVPAQPEAGVIKSKRYGGPEKSPVAKAGPNWADFVRLELEKQKYMEVQHGFTAKND